MSKNVDAKILESSLSAARLSTYINAIGIGTGNVEAMAIELYLWNAEICAAFMLPLHVCEVTLRNAVAQAITNIYGENWPWHDTYRGSLPNKQVVVLEKACETSRQLVVSKIIPELSFSFWQNMLTKRHDERIWNGQLGLVFPFVDLESNDISFYRTEIHQKLDKLRKLRNRIAHHEPVFKRNLAQDIADILQVVHYRCPDTAAWLERHQQVVRLLSLKPL